MEKKRALREFWLSEKSSAKAYMQKHPPLVEDKPLCIYCGSERIHCRIEDSMPALYQFGFFYNKEIGIENFYSYRCVKCASELYRDRVVVKSEENPQQNYLKVKSITSSAMLSCEGIKKMFKSKWNFLPFIAPFKKQSKESEVSLPPLGDLPLDRVLNYSSPIFSGVNNTERLNQLLGEAKSLVEPGFYQGDNFFSWFRNISPLEDEIFSNIFQKNVATVEEQATAWRQYIHVCAASHCIHLSGDFVECGVSLGMSIKTILEYIGPINFKKTFWGFDLFHENSIIQLEGGQTLERASFVRNRLATFPQAVIVGGALPDSLSKRVAGPIAYLHLDLESASIEIAVLDILFEHLVPGGIVIINAYEWAGAHRNHKQLVDHWLSGKNYRVFPLPTGQGLLLKR